MCDGGTQPGWPLRGGGGWAESGESDCLGLQVQEQQPEAEGREGGEPSEAETLGCERLISI